MRGGDGGQRPPYEEDDAGAPAPPSRARNARCGARLRRRCASRHAPPAATWSQPSAPHVPPIGLVSLLRTHL